LIGFGAAGLAAAFGAAFLAAFFGAAFLVLFAMCPVSTVEWLGNRADRIGKRNVGQRTGGAKSRKPLKCLFFRFFPVFPSPRVGNRLSA
jgi:hypothetical protein